MDPHDDGVTERMAADEEVETPPAPEGSYGTVTVLSGPARGTEVQLTSTRFTIGRRDDCDLVLDDTQVSLRHASLRVEPAGVFVHDLDSTNGTVVNGRLITGPFMLHDGDAIQVGDTTLGFGAGALPAGDGSAEAAGGAASIRQRLSRASTRSTIIAVAALATTALLLVLVLTGTLPRRDKEKPPPIELTTADVVDAIRPSTVLVSTMQNGRPRGSGTGWVLDAAQGLIVTNNHVIDEGTAFTVGVGGSTRDATLVGVAPCEDTAVLKVTDTAGLRTMALGSQVKLRQGDQAIAVGFPVNASEDETLTTTSGVVSIVKFNFTGGGPAPDLVGAVRTDTPINPGNSGGPLVTKAGLLIGMNTVTLVGLQNSNYAVGVDRIKEVTASLRRGESVGWAGMGLAFPSTPDEVKKLGIAQAGIAIVSALPGSPADAAGLGKKPAVIRAIDGTKIDGNMTSYCAAVGSRKAGESAVFTVMTAGTTRATDVTVKFG